MEAGSILKLFKDDDIVYSIWKRIAGNIPGKEIAIFFEYKDLERTMTMALGIVEIVEEDCGTDHCIEFIVFSKKHAESLVGKYYKDPLQNLNWQVLDLETANSLINKKIYIRSPMTCQTPNFRVCQKCFGAREFPTKYVGVCAGQIVSERLTQLIMRLK
jgi:hypothetical protein